MQLARRVAAGWSERIDASAPDVGRQRRHRAQGFAQRGAIVRGNPAAEVQQALVEGGLFVQQPQRFLRRAGLEPAVGRQNHAGQLARSEGNQDPAAGLNAPAQRFGKPVGEGVYRSGPEG